MPTALLGSDGARPTGEAIHAVHYDGRAFEDDDEAQLRESCYDATHYSTHHSDDEDQQLDAAYELARQLVATPRVVNGPELGVCFRMDGSRLDTVEPMSDDGLDLRAGFDEEHDHNLNDMSLEILQQPTCRARSGSASKYTCWQCGQNSGYEFQMPNEVFETSWRTFQDDDVGQSAVSAVKQMATLLRQGKRDTVCARCCVCSNIDCMLKAGLMTPEWRAEWLDGLRRPQEERETSRKNQVILIERNMRLLHDLVKGGVLDSVDVRHLLTFVASNSQFVHEREKKFIATAMAAADNPHILGFRFPQPQRFVDRMAAFAHGYVVNVLSLHAANLSLSEAAWEGHLQKLVDTALPKAHDAIFALMVEATAETNGYECEALVEDTVWDPVVLKNGRMVHHSSLEVFQPRVFFDRLSQCVAASPTYELGFDSSNQYDGSNTFAALATANHGKQKGYEIQAVIQALQNGAQKATAHGSADLPASSDLQRETNVHPRLRYKNLFIALGYSNEDAEMRVALLLDYRTTTTSRSGRISKPIYVLRMPTTAVPTRTPAKTRTLLGVRRRAVNTSELIALGSQPTGPSSTESATRLLEVLRVHGSMPVIDLAPYKRDASRAFSLVLLSPAERALEVETQAWDCWWTAWLQRRPDASASPATRTLVASLNSANALLNSMHTVDPSQLFAAMTTLRDATTNPHPIVQHLVGGFESFRLDAAAFLHAHQVSVTIGASKMRARQRVTRTRTLAGVERTWAFQQRRCAERGDFLDPEEKDRLEFVQHSRMAANENLERRQQQLEEARQELCTARRKHTNDLRREQRLEALKGTPRTRRRLRKPVVKEAPDDDADARLDTLILMANERHARRLVLLERFARGEAIECLDQEFAQSLSQKV